MKTRVFDSWPMLEWISGREASNTIVQKLLAEAEQGSTQLLMSAINVGEVYYCLQKRASQSLAESWRASSPTLPATIEVPSAEEIWDAAALKGRYRISYAGAFAAALAQKYNCPLVTGDPEFRAVDHLQLEWISRQRH